MDPITTAIVAAVIAGLDEEEKHLLVDDEKKGALSAYEALKEALDDKYSPDSELMDAVMALEGEDSPQRRRALAREVETVAAAQDPVLVEAARELQTAIAAWPGGDEIVARAKG